MSFEQKLRFDEKLKQLRSSQSKNVKMFSEQVYIFTLLSLSNPKFPFNVFDTFPIVIIIWEISGFIIQVNNNLTL